RVLFRSLQLLDDGRLTDGHGRTVNFRNPIVITTSNLGSAVFQNPSIAPDKRRDEILDDIRAYFRPEFINRIDEIVVFEPLTREDLRTIVDLQVRGLASRLAERKLTLEL